VPQIPACFSTLTGKIVYNFIFAGKYAQNSLFSIHYRKKP
jgi:hypothetical protein